MGELGQDSNETLAFIWEGSYELIQLALGWYILERGDQLGAAQGIWRAEEHGIPSL